ncbi:ArnT family glycosyltransferase [Spirosoma rhododendri]|uniref:Phospholipid carrier-dependent glycosyltransferase n=1 Tax=Spirosoma rhododendri TaxID=2728024 RepID=A0A7L5DMA7_9BACT|nr:glycosyltransferase family 39 protein [Spirosoma rhododendri]QJD78662.1 phospholipid carrier-dependent glycosyltransferase [Spirosoma rhododendri]
MITSSSVPLPDRLFYALIAVGVALNATGLLVPIIEPDDALYATIPKTMVQTGDWVRLYVFGRDWLDKPHFQFWMTAISYSLFGVSSFAYKLPALLFFLGGVYYTYLFAQLAYSKRVAQVATLVLLTAFHTILSNNDVRAEPYLMGLIIGAVYHFYRLYRNGPGWHLWAGALLTGCAMMTKGPFVLLTIGAGLVVDWLLTGNWRELLRPRWYAAVLLAMLFAAPELYCLYVQFDQHPETVVFGRTNVSGIRFFFWDSQFGRFFNTGPIKGDGDKFFFLHTLLWAFLPWSLPLYVSVGQAIGRLVRRQRALPEYVSLGSGLLMFVVFSLSRFQLPHYLNILFPFYAVLTAQFLVNLKPIDLRRWSVAQLVIGLALIALMIPLLLLVRPTGLVAGLIGLVVVAVGTLLLFRRTDLPSLLGRMTGVMLVVAVVVNVFLFGTFVQYQAGMMAARFANKTPSLAGQKTFMYGSDTFGESSWTYEFDTDGPTQYVYADSTMRQQAAGRTVPVFTSAPYADSLSRHGFQVRQLAVFPYYHITQPDPAFLNHATRASTTKPYVLLLVKE